MMDTNLVTKPVHYVSALTIGWSKADGQLIMYHLVIDVQLQCTETQHHQDYKL